MKIHPVKRRGSKDCDCEVSKPDGLTKKPCKKKRQNVQYAKKERNAS